MSHFPFSPVVESMALEKQALYDNNSIQKGGKYVQGENDQTIGWFFRCTGRGCRLTCDRDSNQNDRQFEFSESAGRPGGPESGHRQFLGPDRRSARRRQEDHRREEQATRNRYPDVAAARTLCGGRLQGRRGGLRDERLRGGFDDEDDVRPFVGEDPQDRTRCQQRIPRSLG